ncbi:hypothetical protein COHCIP112018_04990 [Cohnella sp. JJ-181]|nr:hypothetical protein COHCIP112018_04990 [Cohnella sp. JJ-181]
MDDRRDKSQVGICDGGLNTNFTLSGQREKAGCLHPAFSVGF